VKLYGIGNQQLEGMFALGMDISGDQIPPIPPGQENFVTSRPVMTIDASIANSPNKIKKLLTNLSGNHAPQVIIATSLLTSPPKVRTPDLIVIVSADMGLHIPHYAASWDNFCFLRNSIQNYPTQHFILQSFNSNHASIHLACKGDEDEMKMITMTKRYEQQYPPFTQMCALMYKHEIEERLHTTANKLYQELMYLRDQYKMKDLEIYATPPMIYRMFGKYRYNIILK
jgi:primosomal protein N'